jgi:hypothetical protein
MQQQQQVTWADPTTLILFAVAMSCFCLCGFLTAWPAGAAATTSAPLLSGFLFAAAVAVIIGAIIAFKRGDMLIGSLGGVLGALILMGGSTLAGGWTGIWLIAPASPEIAGWAFLGISIIIFLFLPSVFRISGSLFLFLGELVIACALLSSACLGGLVNTGLVNAVGWMLLIFGIYCLYAGFVFITNTIYGRPVISLGAPFTDLKVR